MQLDFKNRSFSFKKLNKIRQQKRIRLLALTGLVVLFLLFLGYFLDGKKCNKIEHLLLEKKLEKANLKYQQTGKIFYHRARKKQICALIELYKNHPEKAEKIFNSLSKPVYTKHSQHFLQDFIAKGDYNKAKMFLNFLSKGERKYPLFYSIIASSQLNH